MIRQYIRKTVRNGSGQAVEGAEVRLYAHPDGVDALPLYPSLTGSESSAVKLTDALGLAEFYVAPGVYRLNVTSGQDETDVQPFQVNDPGESIGGATLVPDGFADATYVTLDASEPTIVTGDANLYSRRPPDVYQWTFGPAPLPPAPGVFNGARAEGPYVEFDAGGALGQYYKTWIGLTTSPFLAVYDYAQALITGAVVDTDSPTLPAEPVAIKAGPNNLMLVCYGQAHEAQVYNADTYALVATITDTYCPDYRPTNGAWDPGGAYLWVYTNASAQKTLRFDTNAWLPTSRQSNVAGVIEDAVCMANSSFLFAAANGGDLGGSYGSPLQRFDVNSPQSVVLVSLNGTFTAAGKITYLLLKEDVLYMGAESTATGGPNLVLFTADQTSLLTADLDFIAESAVGDGVPTGLSAPELLADRAFLLTDAAPFICAAFPNTASGVVVFTKPGDYTEDIPAAAAVLGLYVLKTVGDGTSQAQVLGQYPSQGAASTAALQLARLGVQYPAMGAPPAGLKWAVKSRLFPEKV